LLRVLYLVSTNGYTFIFCSVSPKWPPLTHFEFYEELPEKSTNYDNFIYFLCLWLSVFRDSAKSPKSSRILRFFAEFEKFRRILRNPDLIHLLHFLLLYTVPFCAFDKAQSQSCSHFRIFCIITKTDSLTISETDFLHKRND